MNVVSGRVGHPWEWKSAKVQVSEARGTEIRESRGHLSLIHI